MKITLKLTLDHLEDADILKYFDGMSSFKRNKLIRDLLRDYIHETVSNKTLKEVIQDLRISVDRLSSAGIVVSQKAVSIQEEESVLEDTDILSNLANLGL